MHSPISLNQLMRESSFFHSGATRKETTVQHRLTAMT